MMFPFFAKHRQRYANIPYTPLTDLSPPPPLRRRRISISKLLLSSVLALISIILLATFIFHHPNLPRLQQPSPIPAIPHDFRVVGLVFYGRRSRVEILHCYLQQNLKAHGGSLDEIIFLVRTGDADDLVYLDEIVADTPGYTRRDVTDSNDGRRASGITYGQAWEVVERGTMYIKIDDDIMFIEKTAIASLIATKVAHPEHLLVSTNTINSPRLAFLHSHLGAIHPYLPELSPQIPSTTLDWRPSHLPPWDGNPATFTFRKHPRLPRHGQEERWLPLPAPYNASLTGTPASLLQYASSTEALHNWAIAAQQHYSFLQNLEADPSLSVYGSKGMLWDAHGTYRTQINLICIWGDDVMDNLPIPPDDEAYLTVELVQRLGRAAVVDMGARSVHLAFRGQTVGVEGTDLLARYGALAEEVCPRS
ncbi:MAG: hypothetical protein LQ350_003178 [Teloschistes chrysophthalmus]|nr:MAG: hypothetical protein LQ350_003178 [Niorma chrysophthalma]